MSLAYHLADIYVEELDKALGMSEAALPAPLSTLSQPFLTLAARTINKTTYERIQSALIEPLVSAFSSVSSENEDEDGERSSKRPRLSETEFTHLVPNACVADPKIDGAALPAAVKKALLKQIFQVAGDDATSDANRRRFYAFWKRYADDEDSV